STAMGWNTEASGNVSTAMGSNVSTDGKQGSFIIGDHQPSGTTTSTANNQMMMRFRGGYRLYTNGAATVGVSLPPGASSWQTTSDETKKENYQEADGTYFLESIKKMKLGSWNYIGQSKEDFRHYGPMAQEFYKYFGNDGIGTVGNDTTIASADIDGVMMIAIKALAEENDALKKQNEAMQAQLSELT